MGREKESKFKKRVKKVWESNEGEIVSKKLGSV